MTWRLAGSLVTLRAEVDGYAPRRSRVSDGTLGDPAHASRPSRHNPNRYQVVCALDLTHDPAGGCDIHAIARRLAADPHPELAYIISNAQVAKRATGFHWEPYTGENAHRQHAHFAVGVGPDSDPLPPYDSTLSWGVSLPAPPEPSEDDMAYIVTCDGQPTRLKDGPTCPTIGTATKANAVRAGVKIIEHTKADYDSLLRHVEQALGRS